MNRKLQSMKLIHFNWHLMNHHIAEMRTYRIQSAPADTENIFVWVVGPWTAQC